MFDLASNTRQQAVVVMAINLDTDGCKGDPTEVSV